MSNKIILSLFDESGVWSDPYKDAGYEVHTYDILRDPSEDVTLQDWNIFGDDVHGVILQPPCTHFAASGARWWKSKGPDALEEGLSLIWECIRVIGETNPEWYVLENPVGRLKHYIGDWQYIYNPCEYANYNPKPEEDAYTKKTCLWGKFNMPDKDGVEPVLGSKMYMLPDNKARKRIRSKTPEGFARAFFLANP